MKKIFLCAIVSSILLMSCTTNDARNPAEVLSSFTDAVAAKDLPAAKRLCTPQGQAILTGMSMVGIQWNGELLGKFDKTKIEFGEAVINGDDAKVPVKEKRTGEVVYFPMKKINGQWKVAIDGSSMTNMATEKFKQKTGSIGDSLKSKAKNAITKINLDSLKNKINRRLDSIKF